MATARRRLLAVLALAVVPWTVVWTDRGASAVFSFGLVSTDPFHLVDVYRYLFVHTTVLPARLQAWPAGIVLYAGALASSAAGLRGREDPRLTGGLLLFAGVAHAHVALGLYRVYPAGTAPLVVPLGAVATWTVAWWYYWPLARARGLAPLE